MSVWIGEDGSHFSIFDVPNIDVLAGNMKRCLAGALAELAAEPIRQP